MPGRDAPAGRRREVVARAERVAGAGDDADVLVGIGVEGEDGVADGFLGLVVVGVLLLGAVEREDGDVVVTVDTEVGHRAETVPARRNPVRSS